MPHACHRICLLTPLDVALTMRFAKNTQRDTSEVLLPPRKMTMEASKVIRLPRNMQLIFGKPCKSIALVTQNDLGRFCRHVRMSASATLATQNGMTTCFETFENDRSCSFSHIDTATAEENQRIETRHVGASKRAFRARLPQIFTLRSFKIDMFPRVLS